MESERFFTQLKLDHTFFNSSQSQATTSQKAMDPEAEEYQQQGNFQEVMEKYLPDEAPKSSSQERNIPPEPEVQDEVPLEEEKVSEYTTEEDEEGLASCRSYLEEEMFHSCNSKMEEEDEEEEPPRTAMKKTIKKPLKLV